jgi:hypothetical protein
MFVHDSNLARMIGGATASSLPPKAEVEVIPIMLGAIATGFAKGAQPILPATDYFLLGFFLDFFRPRPTRFCSATISRIHCSFGFAGKPPQTSPAGTSS